LTDIPAAVPGPIEPLVETVDQGGNRLATMPKLAAHRRPGTLHRAFSLFLFDDVGRLLIQQRAATKYHSPLVWSNSCCGHPSSAATVPDCAATRASQELGCRPDRLVAAGTVLYRLDDPRTGLQEHEFTHVLLGRLTAPLAPDPTEVADTKLVTSAELDSLRTTLEFSAWFDIVLEAALPAVSDHFPGYLR
jgi:isopentenyl-diphosphate delta-isomerase